MRVQFTSSPEAQPHLAEALQALAFQDQMTTHLHEVAKRMPNPLSWK